MKVGIVTFDFPPQYRRADVAGRPTAIDSPLHRLLTQKGAEVVAPLARLAARDPGAAGGIRDGRDLALCIDALRAALVEAFLDTDADGLFRWITGASALSSMKRSKVMLWGGSYGAEMPYTRSDSAALEASFLGEVDTEREEVLVPYRHEQSRRPGLRVHPGADRHGRHQVW